MRAIPFNLKETHAFLEVRLTLGFSLQWAQPIGLLGMP